MFKSFFLILIVIISSCSKNKAKLRPLPEFSKENYLYKKNNSLEGTFCFIGDAGHGKPGQFLVGKALAKEGCENIWYVGDIIYPDGLKNTDDPLFISKFQKPYEPVISNKNFKQFHLALGNHDHRGNSDVWADLTKKYNYIMAPHWYFVEQWTNACFFVFDTDMYIRHEYEHRTLQNAWAKHKLETMKECPVTVAVLHHPYISSGGHGDAAGALKKFHEDYLVGHFDLIVAGHEHFLSDEGVYHDTRLLISGAGSESRLRIRHPYQKGYEGDKIGFIKANLEGRKLTYQFIEVSDQNGEPETRVGDTKVIQALGLR
jgi:hypothetical protein